MFPVLENNKLILSFKVVYPVLGISPKQIIISVKLIPDKDPNFACVPVKKCSKVKNGGFHWAEPVPEM